MVIPIDDKFFVYYIKVWLDGLTNYKEKRMSKRVALVIFAVVGIAICGLCFVTTQSATIARETAPERIQPAGAIPTDVEVRILETLMNARPEADRAALTKHDGAPAGNTPAVTVDVDDVSRRASFIFRPYENAEEKRDVLDRLEETGALFDRMIDTTVDSIEKALSDGSRTTAEIDEAKAALAEMKKGRQFISGRIKMVENDEFSQ